MSWKTRLATVVVCVATLVATLSTPANAQARMDISLATASLAKMLPGQSGWVALNFLGHPTAGLCEVELTATAPAGITVKYPGGRAFSAPYKDATFASLEIDYIAISLTVPAAVTAGQSISFNSSYIECEKNKNHADPGKKRVSMSGVVPLPIEPNTGAAFTQTTTQTQAFTAGTSDWVKVNYTGMAPGLTDFKVRVTDAAGAKVSYASEAATASGLSQTSTLGVKQTDFASIRIDTTGMTAGNYTMKTVATYGSPVVSVPGTLTLVVK